jgi:hypothetical protein
MRFVIDGNYGYSWNTDVTNAHTNAWTEKMSLSAAGDLSLTTGSGLYIGSNVSIWEYTSNQLELSATDGANTGAIHVEPTKVEFEFDNTYAWSITASCLQAETTGCIEMMGAEYTDDPSFDTPAQWTTSGGHTVSGGNLNISGTGTCTNDNATLSGREYVTKLDITAASGIAAVSIGGSSIYTILGAGTAYVRRTTVSTAAMQFTSAPGAAVTIASAETYLLPESPSLFGDIEMWGDIDIGGDIICPSGSLTIGELDIVQPPLPSGAPPTLFDITGSDRGDINGIAQPGSSLTWILGKGNNNSAAPYDSGDGGGLSLTCGDGGNSTRAADSAGDGGSIYFETGGGGVNTTGNDGAGGDYVIRLGSKGGGTGSPLDGRFIVENSSGTDRLIIDASLNTFNFTGQVTVGGGFNADSYASFNIVEYNSTDTIAESDYTVLGETSGGDFTLSLPATPQITGQVYNIKNIGTGVLTVGTIGANMIDGSTADITLSQHEVITVQWDGTEWWII